MPSLHDGIAALIVHAASLNVDAAQQFVVFPNFYLPLDKDDVAFNDRDVAFAFALLMNMIPANAPEFNLTTQFVWDVYKDILHNKVLPAPAAGGQGFARAFAEASAQLGIPEMTLNESEFYATSIGPVNLDDAAAWTPVVLGRDAISQLAPQLPAAHQAWLTRFNLLPQLGNEMLEAIALERLTLVVLRPWYNPAVYTWRYWNLPGQQISDGKALPRGRLPGVITKLVLVRKLRLQLATALLSDVDPSILFRPGDAPGTASTAMSLEPVAQLHRLSGAESTGPRRPRLSQTFRQAPGTLAERIDGLQTELVREMGASETPEHAALASAGGFQQFHVPFSFDTQQAREHISAALPAATASRARWEEDLRYGLLYLEARYKGQPELPLRQEEYRISMKPTLVRLQAEETRLRNALSIIEQLSALPVEAQSYILALVCDRTPKAPNPDPSLLTPS